MARPAATKAPKAAADKKSARAPKSYVEPVYNGVRPLSLQVSRIGGGLTPEAVSNILREADSGRIRRLVDLYHESRQKDGHLHATVQALELGVSGCEWDLVAPDGAKRKERQATEVLRVALREIETFDDLAAHGVGEATAFGFAYGDFDWRMRDGWLVPVAARRLHCRDFGFHSNTGDLLYDPNGLGVVNEGGVDLLAEYPAGKLVVYRPRVNGDVPAREGLSRVLVWCSLFRNWTTRDWLQLAEMAWKPWRTGTYKKDASKEDKSNLVRILDEMIATGVAIHPETTELHVEWPLATGGGNQSQHKVLLDQMASEMSKAVLGATLTVDAGTKGARSLGDTHKDVKSDIVDARALGWGRAIQRGIVRPFFDLNVGTGSTASEFFYLTEDEEDVEKFSRMIQNLRKAGLRIPASYVRDRTGIPEPKEGEELLGPDPDAKAEPDPADPSEPKKPSEPSDTPADDAAA